MGGKLQALQPLDLHEAVDHPCLKKGEKSQAVGQICVCVVMAHGMHSREPRSNPTQAGTQVHSTNRQGQQSRIMCPARQAQDGRLVGPLAWVGGPHARILQACVPAGRGAPAAPVAMPCQCALVTVASTAAFSQELVALSAHLYVDSCSSTARNSWVQHGCCRPAGLPQAGFVLCPLLSQQPSPCSASGNPHAPNKTRQPSSKQINGSFIGCFKS